MNYQEIKNPNALTTLLKSQIVWKVEKQYIKALEIIFDYLKQEEHQNDKNLEKIIRN